jgi:hypothetical protein
VILVESVIIELEEHDANHLPGNLTAIAIKSRDSTTTPFQQ